MNKFKGLINGRIGSIINYSLIKYIALIIGFIKGIINARILGPELLGIVGNLFLLLSYLGYSNLGILHSMNREFVIYESRNDIEGAKKVIRTSFTSLLILSVILILVGIGAKIIYKGNLSNYILLVFIIGILEQYRAFYINYFRLINNFRKINFIELISNVLSFLLIIISIQYFEIYSVLISMIIADCMVFIYGYKNSEKIKLNIDRKILKNLITIGVPLLIYNLGYYILTTVDRVMTIKFLEYKDLGYFTFSNQLVGGTLVFISSVLFLYYPKAIKNLNIDDNNNIKEILRRTEQYTRYVEDFGIVLCLVGVILIKPFVDILVPNYDISINIYRILVFGTIANQIAYFSNVFIVSNKKHIYLIYMQIVTVILAVIFNFIFIKLGMGIIGVSLATLITNTIYSIMQHEIYLRVLNIKESHFKNIVKVYSKFITYMFINIFFCLIKMNFALYSVAITMITLVIYYKDFKKAIFEIGKLR